MNCFEPLWHSNIDKQHWTQYYFIFCDSTVLVSGREVVFILSNFQENNTERCTKRGAGGWYLEHPPISTIATASHPISKISKNCFYEVWKGCSKISKRSAALMLGVLEKKYQWTIKLPRKLERSLMIPLQTYWAVLFH